MTVTKKKSKRNYRKEYDNYHGKKEQIQRRQNRNAANSIAKKKGIVKKGDGKDVAHKNGNPNDNKASNLVAQSKSRNRSYSRTRNAKKRNPRA
jgi:hypothetical protein